MAEEFNLSIYNDVYDMSFNQETEEIHIELKEGYYPLSNNVDLSNCYTKPQSDSRYKSINYVPNWSEISGKPTTFTPSAHTHTISEVINLQSTLDNKVDKVIGKQLSTEDYTTYEKNKLSGIQEGAEVNVNADWNATSGDAQILNLPSTFTPSLHTHSISEVDNLQNTLDGKEQKISTGTTSQYWRGDKTWQTLDKNAVGLSNVDNTSDANKPISNATQTALNNKQDVLTEDNVGQFMDSELSTKNTPTSGDTVLARDILTNKAVEIPIESLGGGDTSNLVPYTGANKDVNIASNYFETSQGFKKTGGIPNQALTANGGVFDLTTKADLVGGKIPASQLPAYVDDVLEYANLASFPATGESGKIYIAIDTNLTYRWGGSSYVVMSSSLALGETSSTAYRGDRGNIAYDHSQVTGNPHGTTKNHIGLGNVPNLDTTNAVNNSHTHSNKSILDLITEPFTTSLKSLYDGVVTSINNLLLTGQRLITTGEITKLSNTSGTNTGDETTSSIQTKRPLKTIEGQSLEGSGNIDLTKNDIGLGNVDNTSDLNKPISTATQNALNLKADKGLNIKITTPSNWVTGTTSETEVLRIEIPANSLSDSDVLRIPFLMINKVGTAATIFIRGKLSTSQTMPSGNTDQIFQTAIVAATNQFVGLDRSFIIDYGKIKGFPAGIPSYTSSTISSNLILQKPFNITVTNYLYISVTLGNTADQARLEGMQLTNS